MERFTSSRPALCIRHYLLGFVTLEGSDLYEILWYGVKYSRSLQNPRDTGPSPKLGDQHQPIRLAHLLAQTEDRGLFPLPVGWGSVGRLRGTQAWGPCSKQHTPTGRPAPGGPAHPRRVGSLYPDWDEHPHLHWTSREVPSVLQS